jgi:hypothetical protein
MKADGTIEVLGASKPLGKNPPLRAWSRAKPVRISPCLWCSRRPKRKQAMCTTLGRALCWCWFLMLSLHVIAIDVFFKLWKCDTDQGWWILKAVIQVKVQHHSHVWVLGTISNPRGDVVRSPTSPIRTSLTLVEIAEGTRCSVVLVAWFLQFVHAAF